MVENQESEHQEIESQERLHIQDQMKQITGSKEQIMQFIDLILASRKNLIFIGITKNVAKQ